MEPFYIRQTAEPEHLATAESRRAWFVAATEDAKSEGAVFARYSISDNQTALLIEAWDKPPKEVGDQGHQRWVLTKPDEN